MSWKKKTLEDVADFCLGKMLDQKKNKGDPRPYLANVNVRWGEFAFDNLREMRFEQHELDRFGLKYGDIVMCEGGEPGRCAIWKDHISGMMIQKALHRIRPHKCLDHRFLYYTFLDKGKTERFSPLFTGATIKHLPREKLAKVEIDIPPLPTQHKITSLLSAYDDLIENNTRRIAILEEMAQAVYREWFVNFRFLGHENVKLVDSPLGQIPEGWEVVTLKDVCAEKKGIQTGPFGSQLHRSDYTDDGTPVVMPKDIIDARISTHSIARVPDEVCDRLPRHRLEVGDTVCARRGEIGRNAFVTERESQWMCGTGCMRLRPRKAVISPRYLFDNLCTPEIVSLIAGKAAGAIMPNLNIGIMESVPILLPPKSVQLCYESSALDNLELISTLVSKNRNLRTTRDLLLPKLISGRLNVEDLDIDMAESIEEQAEATA
jgi:type I restriction enzyme, S subunit